MKSAGSLSTQAKIKVLVIGGSDSVGDWMAEIITVDEDMVFLGLVRNLAQALECVEKLKPDVILVDIGSGILEEGDLINRLASPLSDTAIIVVAMMGEVDIVRQAMLHGAQGFLLKPFNEEEMLSSVRAAYELVALRRSERSTTGLLPPGEEAEAEPKAEIISVFSPKGGVGATTVAVNLAVALKALSDKPTILIDGDLRFGDIDIALNINAPSSISTLLSNLDELDEDLVERALVTHDSGVKVLTAPAFPDVADRIQPEQLRELLARLAELYDGYIVVDVWSSLDDCALSVLDACQRLVVVTAPQVTAMRDTHRFLEVLRLLEYDMSRVVLVLNHCYQRGKFSLREVQRALGFQVSQVIDHAPNAITASLNRGVPFVKEHRGNPAAKGIRHLAHTLTNNRGGEQSPEALAEPEPAKNNSRRKRKGLFRR
jgi:pilus assembly protein CpaE